MTLFNVTGQNKNSMQMAERKNVEKLSGRHLGYQADSDKKNLMR
jgi:hypothetical protein